MVRSAVRRCLGLVAVALPLIAFGAESETGPATDRVPFASSYQPLPAQAVLLKNATILTGTGQRLEHGDVLIADGRIRQVGSDLAAGAASEYDASGLWLTPGIIDVHSHIGVYSNPGVEGHSDGNESVAPNTAEVWAEHSVWPQDPAFITALAGGITTLQILPGSANLFGGRGVTLKAVPGVSVMDMKFPDAPFGMKMACGENPKRLYKSRRRSPATRMGNIAVVREAWIDATEYRDKLQAHAEGHGKKPKRDLELETLAGALNGEILVHNHCYRADEMSLMIDVAHEFGYQITAFHHAVEAYKIADKLRDNGICSAIWADWWGAKMEAFDGIPANGVILDQADACVVVHSDSKVGIQRLNQEAAKIMRAAAEVDIEIAPEHAIQWISKNAAEALGILEQTGTVEPGKMADLVLWSHNPFSVYARPVRVYIDGAVAFDLDDQSANPVSDFSLGTTSLHEAQP